MFSFGFSLFHIIKKKISYGTKSEDGKIAWENMMRNARKAIRNNEFDEFKKDFMEKYYG